MAITDRTPDTETAAGDLDVPDFMKPDYALTKPSPIAIQSAAMVVARAAGRGTGAGANWFAAGVVGAKDATKRHLRADDYVEDIGGIEGSNANWQKRQDIRHERLVKFLKAGGITAAGALVANLIAWGGFTWGAEMAAADAWAVAPSAETFLGLLAVTAYGRRVSRRQLPAAPAVPMIGPGEPEDDGEPFPLAWCKDGEQVRTCVQRAFKAEAIGNRRVDILGYRGWGWEIDVDLKGSTPGKVMAASDQLDTHFDIKRGGTLIEPDVERAAHLVLRLITNNPFANMSKAQVHAPMSVDISEPVNMFAGMDGTRPEIVLEGTRILTIGVSGSAKSTGVLRDIAEVVTASHNAIALDLDPIKDGLREFEGVMAAPPIRGNKACEEWLGYLVRMAEARNVVRNRLDMGDTWVATRKHPAIFPFCDEFIYLSPKAKEDFIKLLRLGKQTGIYPIAAGQDATSDSMGDAIADSFTLRVMLASRHADIPLVFGSGAIAAGWRPDRLQPAQNSKIRNDAGRSYIKGAGLDRPILYGWNELSRDQIKRAVDDRLAAGRPWFDYDTLAAADLLHVITPTGPVSETSLADRLDALSSEDAAMVAVLLREFEQAGAGFLPTNETLLPALAGAGFEEIDSEKLGRLLRAHAPGVSASRGNSLPGKPRGWERTAIEQVAAGLLNPVQARSQAG